jgi:hypothetical protein
MHIHTDWWEGFMKYATEMGSGVMIYIPSFSFRHSKLDWGDRHRHMASFTRTFIQA